MQTFIMILTNCDGSQKAIIISIEVTVYRGHGLEICIEVIV